MVSVPYLSHSDWHYMPLIMDSFLLFFFILTLRSFQKLESPVTMVGNVLRKHLVQPVDEGPEAQRRAVLAPR